MKLLTGAAWFKALTSATNALVNNAERINALNVFPVPDGDTGSNMQATLEYAFNETRMLENAPLGELTQKFARGTLMGARGNSGVILSQIFKGFAIVFEQKSSASGFEVAAAFDRAREQAYKSVMKPVEGTILTVVRLTAERLAKSVTPALEIEKVFELALGYAREALADTPNLLPILKDVGVVDSGGEGLVIILEAIYLSLINQPTSLLTKPQNFANSFIMQGEVFDGEYGYCTEFITNLTKPADFKKNKFTNSLAKYGNSIVVVHDEDILKVHIHTETPGAVLTFAQRQGEFVRIKSENMTLQANASNAQKTPSAKTSELPLNNSATTETSTKATNAKVMVVSCNIGQGIINEMRELGTHFIIEAGQTMNPSAKDFVEAISQLSAEKIILLPNNPNIILVAQQVAQTSTKKIVVVPTKTQMQGLAAMIAFDPADSLLASQRNMEKALANVLTGQVTSSTRTTRIEGVQVNAGESLAIAERKILGSYKTKLKAAINVVDALTSDEIEHLVIYYGQGATEADAVELATYVENKYDVDIEIRNGGQPLYDFLLSFNKEAQWK